MLKNQKGQSLIEFLLLVLGFIASIKGVFLLFWLVTNLFWIEHHLYESLICMAEKRNKVFCKKTALNEIKKINKTGELKNINFFGSYKDWKGSIDWRFYKWDFAIQSSLNLP